MEKRHKSPLPVAICSSENRRNGIESVEWKGKTKLNENQLYRI
jgi:hypothetical protein